MAATTTITHTHWLRRRLHATHRHTPVARIYDICVCVVWVRHDMMVFASRSNLPFSHSLCSFCTSTHTHMHCIEYVNAERVYASHSFDLLLCIRIVSLSLSFLCSVIVCYVALQKFTNKINHPHNITIFVLWLFGFIPICEQEPKPQQEQQQKQQKNITREEKTKLSQNQTREQSVIIQFIILLYFGGVCKSFVCSNHEIDACLKSNEI